MSLPASQQSALTDIDRALQASEPLMAAMFGIFTRLNQDEPVSTEQLESRRPTPMARHPLTFVVALLPAMLVMGILSTLIGQTAHGATICGAVTSAGRYVTSRSTCSGVSASGNGGAVTSQAAEGSSCSASLPAARFTGRTADAATPVPPELAAVTTAGPAEMCLQ